MQSTITHLYVTHNVTLVTLINIPYNTLQIAKIFNELKKAKINIDMVSQSSPLKGIINISFSIMDDDLFNAINTLKIFKNEIPELRIEVNSNNTKLTLYGEEMRTVPGVFAETLNLLSASNVEIKMITTSEVEISYLIYSIDELPAIKALSKEFAICN